MIANIVANYTWDQMLVMFILGILIGIFFIIGIFKVLFMKKVSDHLDRIINIDTEKS